jgi:hypothetical protein
MNIFEFIKQLFGPKFGTGSLRNVVDARNIEIAQVQAPVVIPPYYKANIYPFGVGDQGKESSCVGFSFGKMCEYIIYKLTGKIVKIDGNKLYKKAKKEDGIPDTLGTYPNVMAKIVVRDGVEDETGKLHKVSTGYAFIPVDYDAICQAIYQNGVLSAGFLIDKNWFKGIIKKVLKWIGGHQVILYGYDNVDPEVKILHGQNSWGVSWVGYIAGLLDRNVSPGMFEAKFEDVQGTMMNIMALVPVPKELIDQAKEKAFRFTQTLRYGSIGFEVKQLQERLKKDGYPLDSTDGVFGDKTERVVKIYQRQNGLTSDGIVGAGTRAHLNKKATSLIPLWAMQIQKHEGFMTPAQYPPRGSTSFRNNSPANFKLGGELTNYMKKLGASGIDPRGFVIFPTYEIGFQALCTFLTDACNDKLSSYNSNMTLLQFFEKYAPGSDNNDPLNYAKQVAKKVGATVDVKIKELL